MELKWHYKFDESGKPVALDAGAAEALLVAEKAKGNLRGKG